MLSQTASRKRTYRKSYIYCAVLYRQTLDVVLEKFQQTEKVQS